MNLTLVIDADLLKAARLKALQQDTSVNALVRSYLRSYVAAEQRSASEGFLSIARTSTAGRPDGVRWSRDELHER